MKRIEMLFNRIYFSIYSLLYFTNRFVIGKIIKILISRPLYSIPWVRQRLEKNGMDYNAWTNESHSQLDNPRYGLLNWLLGFLLAYIVTSPVFIFIIILQILIGQSFRDFVLQNLRIIVIVVMAFFFLLSYRFVWKNDRFLEYYKKFEKKGRKSVIIWSLSVLLYGIVYAILFLYLYRYAEMKLGYLH